MVVWKNENYQLIVNVSYRRTNRDTCKTECLTCDGKGVVPSDHWVDEIKCVRCAGSGKIDMPTRIPPPPEIDTKFLEELRGFINRYEK